MYTIVRLQLVLEAEPLAAAVALVRLLPGVDALVAPQCPVIPKTAPAVLALKRVIACEKKKQQNVLTRLCFKGSQQHRMVAEGVKLPHMAPTLTFLPRVCTSKPGSDALSDMANVVTRGHAPRRSANSQ